MYCCRMIGFTVASGKADLSVVNVEDIRAWMAVAKMRLCIPLMELHRQPLWVVTFKHVSFWEEVLSVSRQV